MTRESPTPTPAADAGADAALPALSGARVVDVLNDLLKATRDAQYACRACANEVGPAPLRQPLLARADQYVQAATELVGLIEQWGGDADDRGSIGGALHRGWVHLKGAVGADGAQNVLEACELGEDATVARYREALGQPLPADARAMLQHQVVGAQRHLDQIRALRDRLRQGGDVTTGEA